MFYNTSQGSGRFSDVLYHNVAAELPNFSEDRQAVSNIKWRKNKKSVATATVFKKKVGSAVLIQRRVYYIECRAVMMKT